MFNSDDCNDGCLCIRVGNNEPVDVFENSTFNINIDPAKVKAFARGCLELENGECSDILERVSFEGEAGIELDAKLDVTLTNIGKRTFLKPLATKEFPVSALPYNVTLKLTLMAEVSVESSISGEAHLSIGYTNTIGLKAKAWRDGIFSRGADFDAYVKRVSH